jgi:hypothetical protein
MAINRNQCSSCVLIYLCCVADAVGSRSTTSVKSCNRDRERSRLYSRVYVKIALVQAYPRSLRCRETSQRLRDCSVQSHDRGAAEIADTIFERSEFCMRWQCTNNVHCSERLDCASLCCREKQFTLKCIERFECNDQLTH